MKILIPNRNSVGGDQNYSPVVVVGSCFVGLMTSEREENDNSQMLPSIPYPRAHQ